MAEKVSSSGVVFRVQGWGFRLSVSPFLQQGADALVSCVVFLLLQDCAHFDFGDGTCPFGTSCFYRHAYRDGRLEVNLLAS